MVHVSCRFCFDGQINSVKGTKPVGSQLLELDLLGANGRYAIEVAPSTTMQRKMVDDGSNAAAPASVLDGMLEGLDAIKSGMAKSPPAAAPTQAPPLELNRYTAEEGAAQIQAQEEADTARAKQEAQQAAADKARADKADVDARMDASADNFLLGQDANDAVSGQSSVFDAPAQAAPKTVAASAQPVSVAGQNDAKSAEAAQTASPSPLATALAKKFVGTSIEATDAAVNRVNNGLAGSWQKDAYSGEGEASVHVANALADANLAAASTEDIQSAINAAGRDAKSAATKRLQAEIDRRAPAKPAKKPSVPARKKQEHEAKLAARADYFTPGNVITNGMGGHDKVVSYTAPDAAGNWSVAVKAVEQQGGEWAAVPGAKERKHSTEPTARDLKAGAVQRAPEAKADDGGDIRFSRAGNAVTEADRQFKETERAYGGRAAYDRAKAAGKTRLTYGQWVQVRTPKFKAWFGDWQAVLAQQRLDSMEPVKVRVPDAWRGLSHSELRENMAKEFDRMVREKVEIEHPELGTIRVGRAGAKKSEGSARDPAKSLVAADIEALVPASIYARSDASRGGDGPDIAGYSTLLTRVQVDGVDLVASFTVRHQSDGQWYYNAVALHDAKEKAQDSYGRPDQQAGSRVAPIAGLSDFVRRPLARVNPDAVSKVVDTDTGEPLVVYHGTDADFAEFKKEHQRPGQYGGQGFFFTANPDAAGLFGDTVMPVFLQAKTGIMERRRAKTRGEELQTDHIRPKDDARDIWVVMDSTQIKSAIGNNGDFDGANPDIRFSRAPSTQKTQTTAQPQDFVPAPDGGLDYGEITPEMGKAMRRQAGKIRLRHGDDTQGLVHIEAGHLEQFKRLGFESAQEFITSVAQSFTAIYKRDGAALDVVLEDGGRGRLMVQLEMSADGDFYDVKTASPIRADQFKNREPLWERTGTSAPVADKDNSPSPESQSGSASVAPKDSSANYARADEDMSPDLARAILALGQPAQSATNESVRAAVRELVNGGGLLPNRLGRVVVATAAEIKAHWEPLIGTVAMESEGVGRAQGFYDPKTKTVFLIADHIQAGDELGVVAHELMHKHGQAVLGEEGWSRLHSAIEGWATAPKGSMERKVYDEAARRVQASAPELSSQELFPYAVQVALEMGVRPNAIAPKGSIERWLGQVRAALRHVWSKIATQKSDFKSLDLVNLAFAIAQRENPATGTSLDAQGATMQGTEAPLFSRAAATDQTQTEAFKKWFGDSKVVDANGKPLVVYHGTGRDFAEFKEGKRQSLYGGGFYFGKDPQVASSFASPLRGPEPNVMPIYLSLQKPFIEDSNYSKTPKVPELKAKGYDGIVALDGQIVAFYPEQIKSATGNCGG